MSNDLSRGTPRRLICGEENHEMMSDSVEHYSSGSMLESYRCDSCERSSLNINLTTQSCMMILDASCKSFIRMTLIHADPRVSLASLHRGVQTRMAMVVDGIVDCQLQIMEEARPLRTSSDKRKFVILYCIVRNTFHYSLQAGSSNMAVSQLGARYLVILIRSGDSE